LQPEMTIGRSRECSIFLEDLSVSRLHAIVRLLPDGTYEIEDQRSATGTFVNGMAIQRYRLVEGDVIQIGSYHFTFRRSRS
jgi:pSer/pThr/pTyr-binding forkhead associated (FHA) protein